MGNAINQDVRAIWLAVRRHGGWWTTRQVVQHWHPTFALWEVEQYMLALVAGGYLVARDDVNPGTTSYAFTSECQALPGSEDQEQERTNVIHG